MDSVAKNLAALDKPKAVEPVLVAPMNILHAKNMDSFMKVHADFVVVLGMLVLILAILEKLKTKKRRRRRQTDRLTD
jgi:hypothetical protein